MLKYFVSLAYNGLKYKTSAILSIDKKAVCHGAVKRSLGPKYKVKSKAWLYFNLPLEAKVKFFLDYMALSMPIFKKKISAEISGRNGKTFHCSNITTMKSLELFSRNLLKIDILSITKVYTKKAPNIE